MSARTLPAHLHVTVTNDHEAPRCHTTQSTLHRIFLATTLLYSAILLSRLISDVVFIALVFCECYFFALVGRRIDRRLPGRMLRDITTIYVLCSSYVR